MWKRIVPALALLSAAWAQSMEGTWQGSLEAGAVKLRVGLHITRNEKGEWSSTFDSIDQGAIGLPVKTTTVSGATLHFEMPAMHLSFDGKLSADGSQIAGTMTQGVALPIVFKRVEKIAALNRPQNPKPPFPYQAIEVSYENKLGQARRNVDHSEGQRAVSGRDPDHRLRSGKSRRGDFRPQTVFDYCGLSIAARDRRAARWTIEEWAARRAIRRGKPSARWPTTCSPASIF